MSLQTAPFRQVPRRVAHALSELVFPAACAGCGRTLTTDEGDWCMKCAGTLLAITATPYCPRCGIAAGEYLFDETGCPDCRHTRVRPHAFVRVGAYHDLTGQVLRRFKYNRDHRLDNSLGSLLASAIQGQAWHEQIDALVPVPTNWRGRLRHRCWPAGLLAARVAKRLDVPALPLLCLRGKKHPQKDLPRSKRPGNVRGVFHLRRQARIAGARLCVIDDVSTTGSTLREITGVLLEGGAKSVYAAVIAKTDLHRDDDDTI
jgi:ComF family protein